MHTTQRCFLTSECSPYCRVRLRAPRIGNPAGQRTSPASRRSLMNSPGQAFGAERRWDRQATSSNRRSPVVNRVSSFEYRALCSRTGGGSGLLTVFGFFLFLFERNPEGIENFGRPSFGYEQDQAVELLEIFVVDAQLHQPVPEAGQPDDLLWELAFDLAHQSCRFRVAGIGWLN